MVRLATSSFNMTAFVVTTVFIKAQFKIKTTYNSLHGV